MNSGALFWIIMFGLFSVCFFVVAAIVAVKGTQDLKDLLRDTKAATEQGNRGMEKRGTGNFRFRP